MWCVHLYICICIRCVLCNLHDGQQACVCTEKQDSDLFTIGERMHIVHIVSNTFQSLC